MKQTFKELISSEKLVLVDFYGIWCRPCQTLMPILQEVKQQLGDDIKIVKIDIDKNPMLATNYQVRSVPTLILFNEGKPKWRQSGVLQKNAILNVIETHG